MLYELRIYHITPGRLDEVFSNAVDYALPLQREHGFDHVGFWKVDKADPEHDADLVYLLRWESQADRESKWQSFLSDSRWAARQAQTDADTPLVMSETVHFLEPAEFSALQ